MRRSQRQQRELEFEEELEFLEDNGELIDLPDYSARRLLGCGVLGERDSCPEVEEFRSYFERAQEAFKRADRTIEPDNLVYIIACWADVIANPKVYEGLSEERRTERLADYAKVFGLPDEVWSKVIDYMWLWYTDPDEAPIDEFTLEAFDRINWVCEFAGLPLVDKRDPKVVAAILCVLKEARRDDERSESPAEHENFDRAMDYFVELFEANPAQLLEEVSK